MNQPSESEFAQQLLATDQPVDVDATGLTSELVALRRRRIIKTRRAKIGGAAVASVICAVALILAGPHLQKGSTKPSVAAQPRQAEKVDEALANKMELVNEPFARTPSWEIKELDNFQQRLASLKLEVAELRKKSETHQLTILKESVSRDLFE